MSEERRHRAKKAYHLEQSKIRGKDVVEVDFGVLPGIVEVGVGQTVVLTVDQISADEFAGGIDTRLEATSEQVDAHDTEDKPENETDQQHVEYGGNRLN